MFRQAALVLLIALSGCDRLTGTADKKNSDAEAIGYACRVSFEKPEDCMKENDGQSTTAILNGWKAADKDIQDKTLDPTMGASAQNTGASAQTTAASAVVPADVAKTKDQPKALATKPAKPH